MSDQWFDETTGVFRLDEIVSQRETFRKIMEDQMVTDEEVEVQAQTVIDRLKKVHGALPDELRVEVFDLIAEMTVLYAVQKYKEIQDIRG